MIKRAELRTGNLFHNNLGAISILFVREIREDAIIGKELDGVFNGSFDEENISGVPLTEEWLLKFRFSEKRFRVKSNIEYRLLLPSSTDSTGIPMLPAFLNLQKRNDFFTMQYGNFFLELRFVHQLQNLYFALTGNELTLTPAKEKTP